MLHLAISLVKAARGGRSNVVAPIGGHNPLDISYGPGSRSAIDPAIDSGLHPRPEHRKILTYFSCQRTSADKPRGRPIRPPGEA